MIQDSSLLFDKTLGECTPQDYLYRCRGCNKNLANNSPASQYQKQKLIQNTVRVASSLYSMNLAGLTVYQKPLKTYEVIGNSGSPYVIGPHVNWNQMSDRSHPHIQVSVTASGSTYRGSSTKRSIVRLRPGSLSPGGIGVDIKHNSYDRYLNRLKGKAPLRRGVIPPYFGEPYIPFNLSRPIYGGKVFKTSIINGCDCPDDSSSDKIIYDEYMKYPSIQDQIYNIEYNNTLSIGDIVWAKKDGNIYNKAIIEDIEGDYAFVKFYIDKSIGIVLLTELILDQSCCASMCICSNEVEHIDVDRRSINYSEECCGVMAID